MQAYQLITSNGADSLKLNQLAEPHPGRGQVLLRVHATSLNYRDLMVVSGTYNPRMKVPAIPFSDGAGEVVAIGEGVTKWSVGDQRVAATRVTISFPAHRK